MHLERKKDKDSGRQAMLAESSWLSQWQTCLCSEKGEMCHLETWQSTCGAAESMALTDCTLKRSDLIFYKQLRHQNTQYLFPEVVVPAVNSMSLLRFFNNEMKSLIIRFPCTSFLLTNSRRWLASHSDHLVRHVFGIPGCEAERGGGAFFFSEWLMMLVFWISPTQLLPH